MWFNFVKAIWRGEYKVSVMAWATVAGALVYTISPIDVVPELFIPIIGYVDDVGLWAFLVVQATREFNKFKALKQQEDDIVDVESVEVR